MISTSSGRLAQLVRAPALQAGGRRFEPCTAHHCFQALADVVLGRRVLCRKCVVTHFSQAFQRCALRGDPREIAAPASFTPWSSESITYVRGEMQH
jgi:hypothetical protein